MSPLNENTMKYNLKWMFHCALFIFYLIYVFFNFFNFPEQFVNFGDVTGKCYVICGDNIDGEASEWVKKGPNRFYFNQAYDIENKKFYDPPHEAAMIGMQGKVTNLMLPSDKSRTWK